MKIAGISIVSLALACLFGLIITGAQIGWGPFLFTAGIKKLILLPKNITQVKDKAGVPSIRFHDLRHSFSTLSLEQGMDIKIVSHMLGHTDAGFTMNTHMHVTDSMQENVANTMGNLIESAGKDTKKILFPT